jgi:ankyrin repeat protein
MGTVNSIQSIHSPNNDHNKAILTNSSHSLVGRQIEKVRCVAQKAIASIRNGAHTSYRFIADNRKVILITLGTVISSAGLFVVSVLCAKNISQNMRSKRQEPVRVSIPAPAAMLVDPAAKVEEPVKVESVKIEPIKPVKPVLKVYVPNANKELLSAVVLHDFKKVKKILDEWIVDIDYRDYNNGMTFLHNAVSRNNKKIAALLLEHGANPNVESLYTKETPLYTAFLKGKTNLMSLLMDNNAKFNVSKNNNPSYQQVKIFIENDDVDPTVKERLLKYIEKEFEIDILGERLLYDRKKLAHAWGMSGRCSVPGVFVKEDLEGHYGLQTSSFQMKKAAQKFLSKEEVSKHDRQGFFTKEVIGTILEAVEKMDVNYSEKLRSSQEILDDINKGKPVIIPMSWFTRSSCYYNSYLW